MQAVCQSPSTKSLSGGRGSRFLHHHLSAEKVLRCLYGKTPAWMIATTAQRLSASPAIPSAVAVMHSHLGLPSWLVLTRPAERKEERGQMVALNWQGWRGWHRAGHSCESQTAGSHLDPAGAARVLVPITSLETHGRGPCRSRTDRSSSDSPASQQPLGHLLALCQTPY